MTAYLAPTNIDSTDISKLPFFSLLNTISGGSQSDYEFVEGDFVAPPGVWFVPDRGWVTQADLDRWWREDMYIAGGWQSAFNSSLTYGLEVAMRDLKTVAMADAVMILNPGASSTLAFGAAAKAVAENAGVISVTELTGGIFSPLAAFAHFAIGAGAPMSVNINNIGLNLQLQHFTQMQQAMANAGQGSFNVVVDMNSYNTGIDSVVTQAYLGHITLKFEGVISKVGNTAAFDGVARSYHDVYDGNLGDFRSKIAESSTNVLNAMEKAGVAQPFEIQIVGELPVHFRN